MGELRKLQKQYPVMGNIRGRGLMIGVEFTDSEGKPDAATASKVAKYCVSQNLLLLICDSYQNVIRWIPPLTVTKEQIDEALAVYAAGLAQ